MVVLGNSVVNLSVIDVIIIVFFFRIVEWVIWTREVMEDRRVLGRGSGRFRGCE